MREGREERWGERREGGREGEGGEGGEQMVGTSSVDDERNLLLHGFINEHLSTSLPLNPQQFLFLRI
jgi:hypothetical protein